MPTTRKLIDRLITSLEGTDRLWEEKTAALRRGELACRPGCFGCCVGLFAIGLPEALALRRAVAVRAVERSAATFPGDAAAGILDPERSDAAEAAWFLDVRATPCPVLELPAGRCMVYAARPTTCRTYGIALRAGNETLVPACELNFAGADAQRVLETAIEARNLTAVDQSLVEVAAAAGLPAGVETTIAHALTGAAIAVLERGSR